MVVSIKDFPNPKQTPIFKEYKKYCHSRGGGNPKLEELKFVCKMNLLVAGAGVLKATCLRNVSEQVTHPLRR